MPSGTVTFLFTDLEGSTRLWENDPDAMRTAVARHDSLLEDAVTGQGGVVFSRMGDGVAAAFGSAPQAVRAAVDAQLALASEPWATSRPLRARMGIHTGATTLVGDQYDSHSLNRCARLMAVAHGGQVVISGSTEALVGDELGDGVELVDLGEHRLRDLARPMHVFQLAHAALAREFPALASLDSFPGNLPLQVSSFVGRERELARAVSALEEVRVVTLTGVGGVGKTRLALQVAGEVLPQFRDGAWLCELAPVRDPTAVAEAVAGVFEVTSRSGQTLEQALAEFLRGKQLLLVLDNCEHLLESVAELVAALERLCPRLAVLATSREGFGIDGERILAVPSLRAPGADVGLEDVAATDAVRLFVERAQAVKADFAVTRENASAVAQICRRLDGVPLAIELAAARIPAMNPAELARRLDRRFEFLAGGRRGAVERHQTLRAAIDWSYDLLAEPARRLLDRLAVFAGGCTLDGAEAVCSGDPVDRTAVWELLASLVGQSLVVAEDHGFETRYRLLETIRQYGEARLDEHDETAAVRDRHAEHCVALGAELSDQLQSPRWVEIANRLAAEQENFLAAMSWAIDTDDVDLGFRLLSAFPPTTEQVGLRLWLPVEAVLSLAAAPEHRDYPYGLGVAAFQAAFRGDRPVAEELCEQAIAAEQRVGPRSGHEVEVFVTVARTALAFAVGDWHGAAVLSEHQAELSRGGGPFSAATGFSGAAACYVMAGDPDAALPLATEGLTEARRDGTPFAIAIALCALAGALADRDPARAKALLRESREISATLHYENTSELTQAVLVAARLRDAPFALQLAKPAVRHLHWSGDRPQLGGVLNVVAWAIADAHPDTAATIQGTARALMLAGTQGPAASDSIARPAQTPEQTGAAAGPGFLAQLRRETTRRLADVLGDARLRELRQQGEAMDADQAVGHVLAHIDTWADGHAG